MGEERAEAVPPTFPIILAHDAMVHGSHRATSTSVQTTAASLTPPKFGNLTSLTQPNWPNTFELHATWDRILAVSQERLGRETRHADHQGYWSSRNRIRC